MSEQGHSQYAAASNVPLIKSPSLRVPHPVELPQDIHPLPEDVTAYFVYPFTLEPHILTMESARQSTLAAHAARRDAYLHSREDEKERRKREALRRIAPGFEPQGVPLVPVRVERPLSGAAQTTTDPKGPSNAPKSVMDDLVDQLAAMDARAASGASASSSTADQSPSSSSHYVHAPYSSQYQDLKEFAEIETQLNNFGCDSDSVLMIQTNLIQNAHADLVCDAAYDFYGTRLATAGLDQRIKIWRLDEQTGDWSVEDEWKAHDAAITRLSWAHPQHGQFIVSSSFDRTVRVWERSPPDTSEHGLNAIGSSTRGGERWVERALLTEAKGSVRSIEWAPKGFGMKVASISTDNHLRLYECLESGSSAPNAPTSLLWTLVEEVDIPSLPLISSVSSSPADANTGVDATPGVSEPLVPAMGAGASTPTPSAGSTSPYMNAASLSTPGLGIARPGSGNREADGGWDLSWCKEAYWGEVCAVVSGINGVVKIIHFPPAQRPKTMLILDPKPSKSPVPASPHELPPIPRTQSQSQRSSPTYAHLAQGRRGERDRDYQQEPFAITSVAWAPSCGRSYHLIATGGRDGRVRVWKVRPPEPEAEEPGLEASGNGVWSATVVADFDEHRSPVGRVEWNVTGTVLSSAGNDGKVRLWRSTYGNVWRPMGSLDVVQSEDPTAGRDVAMEE